MADPRAHCALNYALERVRDEMHFVMYKVTSGFCATGAFSNVSFDLAAHVEKGGKIAMQFDTLFNVDAAVPVPEMVDFIGTSRKRPWPPWCPPDGSTYKPSEQEVMVALACEILAPLCQEVLMERRAHRSLAAFLSKSQNPPSHVTCAHLGMGSLSTWHGTPDLRVRSAGVECVCLDVEEDEACCADSDDEARASDGQTTTFEGKTTFNSANLQQAIATCVVSSFTERNCHPDKLPIVPTLFIDQRFVRVILYDCEKDLLMSPSKNLCSKGTVSQTAMALLWVVLNHRQFLQGLPTRFEKWPSGIKSRFAESGNLQHVTALDTKDLNWDMDKKTQHVENDTLPLRFVDAPPPKKVAKVCHAPQASVVCRTKLALARI